MTEVRLIGRLFLSKIFKKWITSLAGRFARACAPFFEVKTYAIRLSTLGRGSGRLRYSPKALKAKQVVNDIGRHTFKALAGRNKFNCKRRLQSHLALSFPDSWVLNLLGIEAW